MLKTVPIFFECTCYAERSLTEETSSDSEDFRTRSSARSSCVQLHESKPDRCGVDKQSANFDGRLIPRDIALNVRGYRKTPSSYFYR